MAIFKIEKNKDYTVMSNYHLRDKNLSLKAKGLLSYMLSLPEDWDYSLNGLSAINKENIKAIRTIVKELENNNYLKRDRINGNSGRFIYQYTIYEKPYFEPYPQKGYTVEGHTLKDTQINTNIQIDKVDKTNQPNIFILELIKLKYLNGNEPYLNYYEKLFDNYKYLGYTNKQIFMAMHYFAQKVTSNNFKDEDGNLIENKYGYLKESMNSNLERIVINESIYDDLQKEYER